MDFLTTARMLMDLQAKYPEMRYDFVEAAGTDTVVRIELRVDESVPDMFVSAARMFEPI